MKLFSAIFDVVLIPVAVAKDVVTAPLKVMDPFSHEPILSETRKQVEKADEDLEG